ncbi:hypothetical protein PIB30_037178 [Stylosanthes scabra]|uniref:Uncharacterized protein n=1 Tax=Stylosanthes scabra TaxID=79078 RepID=A0ABU6VCF9_9FABA|nr:hypothetical protein [Stylosanthes scabra]
MKTVAVRSAMKQRQRPSIEGATTSKMIGGKVPLVCDSEKEEEGTDGGEGKSKEIGSGSSTKRRKKVEGKMDDGSGRTNVIGDHLAENGRRRSLDGAAPYSRLQIKIGDHLTENGWRRRRSVDGAAP